MMEVMDWRNASTCSIKGSMRRARAYTKRTASRVSASSELRVVPTREPRYKIVLPASHRLSQARFHSPHNAPPYPSCLSGCASSLWFFPCSCSLNPLATTYLPPDVSTPTLARSMTRKYHWCKVSTHDFCCNFERPLTIVLFICRASFLLVVGEGCYDQRSRSLQGNSWAQPRHFVWFVGGVRALPCGCWMGQG